MGMISKTVLGIVIARRKNYYTMLLSTGNRIKIKLNQTNLKYGSKHHIAFNNATGKIINIIPYENFYDINTIRTYEYENEKDLTPEDLKLINEVLEFSREQENEDFESLEDL